MRIVVFGANGPTGREVVRPSLAQQHSVTAVTRRPTAFPIDGHPRLRVVRADVRDADAVEGAVAGQEAVSTLGVPFGRQAVTVHSTGAQHIPRAMRRDLHLRAVVEVRTEQGTPGILDVIRKEVFGK
jgi:uncharacterized protein YbjT (DUF2867 family)